MASTTPPGSPASPGDAKDLKKKVSLVGAWGVGKTSLMQRFISSLFSEKYHATLGVKVDKKTVNVDGTDLTLMIWDIAGAEDHFTVPSHYVKGSEGYLLVIDGTRRETLERALDLVAQLDGDLGGRLPLVVLINKCDLADRWQMTDEVLAKLAPLNCPVYCTSAKTGVSVEDAFLDLAKRLTAIPPQK